MKNITVVAFFIKKAIEKYSAISDCDEFSHAVWHVLSEQIINKQNSAELIFLIYQYPRYVRNLVEEMNVPYDDYDDTAVTLYRRILHGASMFDISMSDVFPAARDAWYAPWCNGYLATRPILHKDICTFFCPGSVIVGPYQLALADKYGNVVPDETYDFDFDLHLDLEDDANYDDYDSDEEESNAIITQNYCADHGVMFDDIVPCAAAQVVDIVKDSLYGCMEGEFEPLINDYKRRVVFVANWFNTYIHHQAFNDDVDKRKWQAMFDIVYALISEDVNAPEFSSPLAKLLYTLYPVFSANKESAEFKMQMCYDLMFKHTSERSTIGYVVKTDWNYYGQFPMTILRYLAGEILLDTVQLSLRKEFGLVGPKSFILMDEESLLTRDRNGEYVSSNSSFLPLIDHWSDKYPVFIRASKASQFLARKMLTERDYPCVYYTARPPDDIATCADFSIKGVSYACLFVGGIGYGFENDIYVRCKNQAAVCLGFALRAVLARGSYHFNGDGDGQFDSALTGSTDRVVPDPFKRRMSKGYRKREEDDEVNRGVKNMPKVKNFSVPRMLKDSFSDIEDEPAPRIHGALNDFDLVSMAELLASFNFKTEE